MPVDPVTTAGLAAREVRTGSRDGAPAKIAVARRAYPAGRAGLWDALTSPERIARWFLPVSGELKAGGRYQLEGNAGGAAERCDEPGSFAVTWESGEMMSWLTVTLTPDGAGTRLELAHESHAGPALRGQSGPGAAGAGWDLALTGPGLHLGTGRQAGPATAVTLPASPEGRQFIRLAATGRADAAVSDGAEPGPGADQISRKTAMGWSAAC